MILQLRLLIFGLNAIKTIPPQLNVWNSTECFAPNRHKQPLFKPIMIQSIDCTHALPRLNVPNYITVYIKFPQQHGYQISGNTLFQGL